MSLLIMLVFWINWKQCMSNSEKYLHNYNTYSLIKRFIYNRNQPNQMFIKRIRLYTRMYMQFLKIICCYCLVDNLFKIKVISSYMIIIFKHGNCFLVRVSLNLVSMSEISSVHCSYYWYSSCIINSNITPAISVIHK